MATAQRDYYDVLGVEHDADAKAIRSAFRALTLKYHPDRNKSPEAEEKFKEINEVNQKFLTQIIQGVQYPEYLDRDPL